MMRVSETLRAALKAAETSGVTRYRISKETGVDHTNLTRFLRERRDVRVSTVDALADFLGLELAPKQAAKKPENGSK